MCVYGSPASLKPPKTHHCCSYRYYCCFPWTTKCHSNNKEKKIKTSANCPKIVICRWMIFFFFFWFWFEITFNIIIIRGWSREKKNLLWKGWWWKNNNAICRLSGYFDVVFFSLQLYDSLQSRTNQPNRIEIESFHIIIIKFNKFFFQFFPEL